MKKKETMEKTNCLIYELGAIYKRTNMIYMNPRQPLTYILLTVDRHIKM